MVPICLEVRHTRSVLELARGDHWSSHGHLFISHVAQLKGTRSCINVGRSHFIPGTLGNSTLQPAQKCWHLEYSALHPQLSHFGWNTLATSANAVTRQSHATTQTAGASLIPAHLRSLDQYVH